MDLQESINQIRNNSIQPQKLLVAGAWQEAEGNPVDVVSPIDGQRLTTLASAAQNDVDKSVAAARESFEKATWAGMPPRGKQRILHKIADLIEANSLELAVLGVRDNGTEIGMALKAEPGSAAGTFRYYAEAVDKINGEIAPAQDNVLALVHKEPVGVVGAIVPWNFPLMIGAWKIAPALAAGNSIIVKPSENASLSLLRLAEIIQEAGVPEGVFNIVTGSGRTTGEALSLSMGVDVLAFTGSGAIGRRLLENSARSNLKKVYLELGGKSPNIIFDDVPDLEKVAKVAAGAVFRNSGQVCVAGSRLLVEASIHDAFVELVARNAERMTVGDPLQLTSDIGAVNSRQQLDSNLAFVDRARQADLQPILGGRQILAETGGYYMEPTIYNNVDMQSELFQEEVFGPVLTVTRFESDEEAVRLANATDFGLAAGVWTSSLSRAHRMIKAIKSGTVFVNTYGGAGVTVPLSGHKQSGNGSDKSMHALDKFLDLKSAWVQI